MICMQCGQVYEKGKFCVKCGIALTEQEPAGAPVDSAASKEGPAHFRFSPEPQAMESSTVQSQEAPPAYAAAQPGPAMTPVSPSTSGGSSVPSPTYAATAATSEAASQEVPALPSMAQGWNQVKQSQIMQQGSHISKQFGSFYIKALMYPFLTTKSVGKSHFTNGIITMFLTSLLIPLVSYFAALQFFDNVPFGKTVIKPLLLIWIALLLASAIAYAMIRLGRVASDFMTVTAKLGTMLVPASAALVLCNLSVLLDFGVKFSAFLLLAAMLLIFGAITAVVLGTRKESMSGLDPLYGAVITNLAFGYILYKFADFGVSNLMNGLF